MGDEGPKEPDSQVIFTVTVLQAQLDAVDVSGWWWWWWWRRRRRRRRRSVPHSI